MTEDNHKPADTKEHPPADGGDATAPAPGNPDTDGTDNIADAARALTELRRLVLGQVTLSFPERDVVWAMDWTAAKRLLTMYSRRRRGVQGDTLDADSDPFAAWMVVDTDTVLAMAWTPGTPSAPTAPSSTPNPSREPAPDHRDPHQWPALRHERIAGRCRVPAAAAIPAADWFDWSQSLRCGARRAV